jgi:hypothetical protein
VTQHVAILFRRPSCSWSAVTDGHRASCRRHVTKPISWSSTRSPLQARLTTSICSNNVFWVRYIILLFRHAKWFHLFHPPTTEHASKSIHHTAYITLSAPSVHEGHMSISNMRTPRLMMDICSTIGQRSQSF